MSTKQSTPPAESNQLPKLDGRGVLCSKDLLHGASLGPYALNEIFLGDSRELAKAIPDESVDIIFTDPPYPKEYIPLYGWLCETAMRVLKPSGFCCFIAASLYLDKIFQMATASGLSYYFKIESLNTKDAPVIWPRRILNRSKPILMWTKGKNVIAVHNMSSIYQGQGPDKRYHKWGQDEGSARYVIEYTLGTGARATLLEPFCGGGATLQACKAIGLDYVGFEIDATAYETSRRRMAGYDPILDDDQTSLWPAPCNEPR